MKGRSIPLSRARTLACDFLQIARKNPTVPVQKCMNLRDLLQARQQHPQRPSWSAIFIKGYALVAQEFPELRRAYIKIPWHRLYEYPKSVAHVTLERDFDGEKCVFAAKIKDPASLSVLKIHEMIKIWKEIPIRDYKEFRRGLWITRMPWPIRPFLWWLGLNIGRQRGNFFGTFTLSVYSGLGVESLHPLTPTTTTLNYGVIDSNGNVTVRIVYDHRVMDGATVARALIRLEAILSSLVLDEVRTTSTLSQAA
jgi:hypothetical protein